MTDGTGNLLLIAVHPDHQGRGIGAARIHDYYAAGEDKIVHWKALQRPHR